MKIEEGKGLNNNTVWFVLDGADLIETFNTIEEAETFIKNN